MAVVCPESKAPTRSWAPSLISFSARARAVSTFELGVDADDSEFGHAQRFEDRRRDIDAELTILADAGLQAGTRQQHADLERAALGAHDIERRDAGNECGGTGAGGKSATCDAPGFRPGFLHREILPWGMLRPAFAR